MNEVFRGFKILKGLPDGALNDLARSCTWRSVAAGKQILLAHQPASEVFFVAEGRVRILLYSAAEGRLVLLTVLGPHEMFGELGAIDGRPRSATVEAEKDCLLAILPNEQFIRLVREHPDFSFAVMRQLAAQIRRLTDRVYEHSTLDVPSRVHAELLRLVILAGEKNGQALLSPVPLRVDFAASIGTTREAVSRVLTSLEEAGIAQREGLSLRILDVAQLRKLVLEAKGE
jgi:CRP/FNR family transcriptional regulator, cyclic AMP receptor protein